MEIPGGGDKHIVRTNEEKLIDLPINKWMERLTALKTDSIVCDVASIKHRLNQLCA